jgi:hypothetical protein
MRAIVVIILVIYSTVISYCHALTINKILETKHNFLIFAISQGAKDEIIIVSQKVKWYRRIKFRLYNMIKVGQDYNLDIFNDPFYSKLNKNVFKTETSGAGRIKIDDFVIPSNINGVYRSKSIYGLYLIPSKS